MGAHLATLCAAARHTQLVLLALQLPVQRLAATKRTQLRRFSVKQQVIESPCAQLPRHGDSMCAVAQQALTVDAQRPTTGNGPCNRPRQRPRPCPARRPVHSTYLCVRVLQPQVLLTRRARNTLGTATQCTRRTDSPPPPPSAPATAWARPRAAGASPVHAMHSSRQELSCTCVALAAVAAVRPTGGEGRGASPPQPAS
jgi:hypothetical protein